MISLRGEHAQSPKMKATRKNNFKIRFISQWPLFSVSGFRTNNSMMNTIEKIHTDSEVAVQSLLVSGDVVFSAAEEASEIVRL